jgi:hypothetical protein
LPGRWGLFITWCCLPKSPSPHQNTTCEGSQEDSDASKPLIARRALQEASSNPVADILFDYQRQQVNNRNNEELALRVGVEMEYLFPNTTELNDDDEAKDRLEAVQASMKQVGIESLVFTDKDKQPNSNEAWEIVREHGGFELVSPILTRLQPLKRAMQAMHHHSVGTDVMYTNFHTSIDATNRTFDQVRNVYKNFMAVEEVLDTLRDCEKQGDHSLKSLSIRKQFHTLKQGYVAVDACRTGDYDCLVETAEGVAYGCGDCNYYHLVNLRYDWEEINDVVEEDDDKPEKKYRMWPERLEFRGQRGNSNPDFVASWVLLLHNLVKASYDGIVLEPTFTSIDRSEDQAWDDLFTHLIRNDQLRVHMQKYRGLNGNDALQRNMNCRRIDTSKLPVEEA